MTYTDLPHDWQSRSLADPALAADVLDLFTDIPGRRHRALVLVVCDHSGRALSPIVIDRPPAVPSLPEPILARVLAQLAGLPVVLGFARPGPGVATEADLAWRAAATSAAARSGARLLGCFLISGDGIRPIPEPPEPHLALAG